MAVSAADKPIYVPQVRPQVSDSTSELARMVDWSAREFENVSRGLIGGVPRWNLQTINAPPSRPRTGDIEYADGVNWNPGYGEGLYVYKGGAWVPFGIGAGGRIRLNVATNFYFDTAAGNDANPGTSTLPWLSPAPLWSRYDFGGQTVTLNLKNNSTVPVAITPWTGGGDLIFDGGGKSISTTSADAISLVGSFPGIPTVQNATLTTTTSGFGLHCQHSSIAQFKALTFGSCAGIHILVNGGGGRLNCTGNYSITGGAPAHAQANPTNAIAIEGVTVTLSGVPAFGNFGVSIDGDLFVDNTIWSGGATGSRYFAYLGGLIYTAGGGPNYLPGNSAGSTSAGGQYI